MDIQLELNETIHKGIRRITTENVDLALDQMISSQFSLDERVHTARKSLKKIRAVLRLVRHSIGANIFHQENTCYRDVGRLLAPMRDSTVLINTLDSITDRYPNHINPEKLKSIRAQLLNYQDHIRQKTINDRVFSKAIYNLDQARSRIKNWSDVDNNFSAFQGGLKRVYKRGYNRMDIAYHNPTTDNLHEWRKRIKYLWYHTRLLKQTWFNILDEFAGELHTLSDYLGDDHDLAEFSRMILQQNDIVTNIDSHTHQTLSGLIKEWRSEYQTHAYALGRRIYAEKPGAFTHRLTIYWQAAQIDVPKLPTPIS